MSFILDALRKAETSRGRPAPRPAEDGRLGDIAAPAQDEAGRRPMLLVAAALGSVAAIAVTAWWLNRPAASPAVIASAPASAPAALPTDDNVRQIQPLDRVARRTEPPRAAPLPGVAVADDAGAPTPARPTPATPRSSGGTVTVADAPLSVDGFTTNASAAVERTAPTDITTPSLPAPRAAEPREQLPGYQELLLSGRARLPRLHLDIHVYAEDPARRFVFINNRKYREGERLDEGGRIERITPLGAVIEHDGNRFELLPD